MDHGAAVQCDRLLYFYCACYYVIKVISSRYVNMFFVQSYRLSWRTVLDVTVNVALLRPAVQSGTSHKLVASRAVDGDVAKTSCTRFSSEPWLSIDLGAPMNVGRVCVTNGHDKKRGTTRKIFLVLEFEFQSATDP